MGYRVLLWATAWYRGVPWATVSCTRYYDKRAQEVARYLAHKVIPLDQVTKRHADITYASDFSFSLCEKAHSYSPQ